MADIDIAQCSVKLYKYKLDGHPSKQWMPIIIIDVPFTRDQVSSGANPLYYGHQRLNHVNFEQLRLQNKSLPLWAYLFKSDIPYVFLEVYNDKNIKIFETLQADGTEGWNCSLTISTLNEDGTSNDTSAISVNTTGYTPEQAMSIIFVAFRTQDNFYSSYQHLVSGIANLNDGSYKINTKPISSTSKGSFSTYGNTIVYDSSSAYWDYNTALGDTIERMVGTSKIYDTNDPLNGGGNSHGGGGSDNGGEDDIGGGEIEGGTHPTISPLDSGLLTCYNPTLAELQQLGKFLWSKNFSVDDFKKVMNDPFDTLLGLSIIPIKPLATTSHNIIFGNLDSGVEAGVVSDPWVDINCGTFTLSEVWHGALDYAPSTSVSIYLPFIGTKELNTNDVMGSTLTLKYHFDVLTGGCLAEIFVNHTARGNKEGGFSAHANMGKVYEFSGQCSVPIPLSSQDYTNCVRGMISAIGMVAGVGASVATGNPALGVMTGMMGTAQLGVQASTPNVQRSGSLGCSSAFMSGLEPGLIVQRPHQCKPERYYALRGVPSQVYASKLANCTGFTQITRNNNIHCSGAQDSELEEIQNLLVSGVYFPDSVRKV